MKKSHKLKKKIYLAMCGLSYDTQCFLFSLALQGSLLWHAGSLLFIVVFGLFSCSMQTLTCVMLDRVP